MTESERSGIQVYVAFGKSDRGFVDKLVEGLQRDGRCQVSITPVHNPKSRNWKPRIGVMISQADTVLFVLSPKAVQSKIFAWEAAHADEASKRIIPILHQQLGQNETPPQLKGLKPFACETSAAFEDRLRSLQRILEINADWLRVHSQLYVRALDWEQADRPDNLLLSGPEVAAAKRWTFERPDNAPKPTELHLTFIEACEKVADASENAAAGAQNRFAQNRARRRTPQDETPQDQADLSAGKSSIAATDGRGHFSQNIAAASTLSDIAASENPGFSDHDQPTDASPVPDGPTKPVDPFEDEAFPLAAAPRHSGSKLHAVLGSALLLLAAVGLWQAVSGPPDRQTALLRETPMQLAVDQSVGKLFLAQSTRIEDRLKQLECLLGESGDEPAACPSADN